MIALCLWCVLLVKTCFSLPLAGWIESPGYPHGYEPHSNLTWERCAPPGHILSLTFLHLDLEESFQCENDAVKVFVDKSLSTTLCGKKTVEHLQATVNPLLYSSAGNCLSLIFESDYSNPERYTGFRAFYTIQDADECWEGVTECSHYCHNYIGGYSCSCKPGYHLSEDNHTCTVNCTEERFGEGELVSPGSPEPYFENAKCLYTLSLEEGKQFVLTFSGKFDVESRDGQCVDYIKIKTKSATLGTFCGQEAPAPIITGAQWVQVIFHTDQAGSNQGFNLMYTSKITECPGTVMVNSVQTPQRAVYASGDMVTVTCITGHTVENSAEKSYTSICQKSGAWSPAYSCKSVDCGEPELPDPDLFQLVEKNPLTTYMHNVSLKCSSEYYQLVGDDTFTCNANGVWESNGQILSPTFPKCIAICGMNMESPTGRIFGGTMAKLGQIPWQLLTKSPKRGGASLISDRWALTAAHVVEGTSVEQLTFLGGMIDAKSDGKDGKILELQIEKIIIHEGYKREEAYGESSYDNDIALLKLSKRVKLDKNTRPVCLPKKTDGTTTLMMSMGTVSGYGGKDADIKKTQFLHYGHVEEFSVPCIETSLKTSDNMFCAGNEDVDSCKGDSGGPLFQPRLGTGSVTNPYTIKGIVSWGPPICGEKGKRKGYYTKVQNYLDWITENMEKY